MHLNFRAWRPLVLLLLSGALLSCGGDGPTEPPPDPVVARLAFVTPPPATGYVNRPLDPQPVLQLLDAAGNPVAKSGVTLKAGAGIMPATGANAITTSDGRGTFEELVLGGGPGTFTLQFTTPRLEGVTPLEHQIRLLRYAPSVIEAVSTPSPPGEAGMPVPVRPVVYVTNASSESAVGTAVTFTIVAGGGTLTDSVQLTDANGMATVGGWILGLEPGENSVKATAEGVSGSVTFTVTGIVTGAAVAQPPDVQIALAGAEAGSAPTVQVTQAGAPKAGALVRFRVVSGGGTVAVTDAISDATGMASAGSWELGAVAGANVVEAEVPGYSPAPFQFRAWGVNQLPVSLALHGGDGQTADAGETLPVAPSVRVQDAGGSPLAGFPVVFALADGSSGSITGAHATTNELGVASVGSWRMPLPNGDAHMLATAPPIEGPPVEVVATVFDDTPANVEIVSGVITGRVATAVSVLPRVRVKTIGGDVLSGVPVEFAIAPGAGSLTGASQISDANGLASPGSWTLGTVAGRQDVSVTAGTVAPVVISATATPGPPARSVVVQGDNQSGPVYNPLVIDPAVRVEDQYGNPVAGAAVDFLVTLGNGRVIPAAPVTSANGEVRARWVLGGSPVLNELKARVPGLAMSSVAFVATATPVSSPFNIEVLYVGTPGVDEQIAVDAAVARWRTIIRGDIPDIQVVLAARACDPEGNQPAINQLVDDVLVVVDFSYIDGPFNVLGSAGPCALRSSTGFPAVGTITIDAADAAEMIMSGELNDVLLHEFGHVLGIGTNWTLMNLLTGAAGSDPKYTGAAANQAYHALGGTQASLPVENTGGAGTKNAHWRESHLGIELMTGYTTGNLNPLSRITSRSLADLGYQIDDATADPLGFTPDLRSGVQAARGRVPLRQLREQPLTGPIIVIYPDGTTRKVPR